MQRCGIAKYEFALHILEGSDFVCPIHVRGPDGLMGDTRAGAAATGAVDGGAVDAAAGAGGVEGRVIASGETGAAVEEGVFAHDGEFFELTALFGVAGFGVVASVAVEYS